MSLFSKIIIKLRGGSVSAADWQEFEKTLIEADLGAGLATEIIALAKGMKIDGAVGADGADGANGANGIEGALLASLTEKLTTADRGIRIAADRPTTILVVGVNGTGKTTSVAKLMNYFKNLNSVVLVAAADTFRAAAIDQIQTWGERVGVTVVAGKPNGDPAAVAFDGIKRAIEERVNILIVDTAGRLHTKSGLMDELSKIRRVIEKVSPIDEVLLVVDATTGQNGIVQAKLFTESVAVSGLILSKMDGSAKGGIALAIESATGIPVKFVGVGEGVEDLRVFDPQIYLQGLIS